MNLNTDPQAQSDIKTCINWYIFKSNIQITNSTIKTKEDINTAVIQLQTDIQTAIHTASWKKHPTKHQNQTIPADIYNKILQKRSILKEYKRTLNPITKTGLNKITLEINENLQDIYNEEWSRKLELELDSLESIDTQDNTLWKIAKALTKNKNHEKIPQLVTPTGPAITDMHKVEAFADVLQETFKPNKSEPHLEALHQEIEEYTKHATSTNTENISEATVEEIEKHNKKPPYAPGANRIPNTAIKHLPEKGIEELKNIFNNILHHCHYPAEWKEAEIILIKKPKKPKCDPTSYRPISLLSAISKIAERVIYTRLLAETEELNLLPQHQFGFRSRHSTTHQIIRLTEHINQQMNISTPTAAVYLDIEKAFDRVWHPGLVYKLKNAGIAEKLTRTIDSYLTNRKFHTRIG